MNFKTSEVALHFSLLGHSIEKHFKFFIYEDNVHNSIIRKSIETDLINIFLNCKLNIINKKIPSIYKCSYLTFQK